MASFGKLCLASCLGWIVIAGCENAEQKARYVKAPLESVDVTDRAALNQAVAEAKTRLVSVRDARLRSDLALDIDATYERAMAHLLEAEREEAARKERELEQERQAVRTPPPEPPPSKPSSPLVSQDELRRAALAAQNDRAKKAVTDLEVGVRDSAFGDGSKVLVLKNVMSYAANFELRCHAADGSFHKAFAILLPAYGEKRIGFVQGWPGNFKGGESCEAYVDGERLWEYSIP